MPNPIREADVRDAYARFLRVMHAKNGYSDPGTYHLSHQSPGWQLQYNHPDGGVIEPLGPYRVDTRTMYFMLEAAYRAVEHMRRVVLDSVQAEYAPTVLTT
jgi:hypothetical protein